MIDKSGVSKFRRQFTTGSPEDIRTPGDGARRPRSVPVRRIRRTVKRAEIQVEAMSDIKERDLAAWIRHATEMEARAERAETALRRLAPDNYYAIAGCRCSHCKAVFALEFIDASAPKNMKNKKRNQRCNRRV
jgi:hypothetical protein